MINAFTSFFDNAKEKLTNPFFGTLIFVWLVRNWELIYTIFNFDDDCDLDDKKSFIITYYRPKDFWNELFTNVGIAMGLMLFGYLLIIITRVIINIVENNLMPFLNKKTVSKLVTNIGIHEVVVKQRDEFFEKYNIERDKARDAVRAYDNLKTSSDKETDDYQNKIAILDDKISSLEEEKDGLKEKINSLNDGSNSQKNLIKQFETTIQTKDNELNDTKLRLLRTIDDLNGLQSLILSEIQNDYLDITNNENISKNFSLYELYSELKGRDLLIVFGHFLEAIESKTESSLNNELVDELIKMRLLRYKDSKSPRLSSSFNIEATGIGKIMGHYMHLKK